MRRVSRQSIRIFFDYFSEMPPPSTANGHFSAECDSIGTANRWTPGLRKRLQNQGRPLLKTMLLASAAIGALMVGGAAYAADLPASAPVYKATPMAPTFSWAGFYLGIEGGGAWGKSRQRSDVGDIAP